MQKNLDMKQRFGYLLLLALTFCPLLKAQEAVRDTVRFELGTSVKEYDGFLLDMDLMSTVPLQMPEIDYNIFPKQNSYEKMFDFKWDEIYAQNSPASGASYWSPFGRNAEQWQSATFKLKNGMKISTYGNYNSEGYRVYDPSALPWERNNFKGAFELKSANGSFGIKLEVRKENGPFPY